MSYRPFSSPFLNPAFSPPSGYLHLYVVEILGRGVKVGVTSREPRVRIDQHRRDAEAYGCCIGRTWVSALHREARQNEKHLIRMGGPGQIREYLSLPFDEVVAHARVLTQPAALGGLSLTDYFKLKLLTP